MEDLLNRRVPSVKLPGVPLSDSVDFLRDITRANLYVDWKALELAGVTENTRITVFATNLPLREAFQRILDCTGSHALEIHVMHGMIVVSTTLNFADRKAQKGPYLAELSDATETAAVLDRPLPSVQLPSVRFADAIDFLRDITGNVFLVKWDKLKAAGIDKNNPVSLTGQDIPISCVLYFILDQAGEGKLGYVTEPTDGMGWDKKLRRMAPRKVELITISTIDDLVASKAKPTTRPN
jgi:hypothetical protein